MALYNQTRDIGSRWANLRPLSALPKTSISLRWLFLGLVASVAIPLIFVAVYGIRNVVQEERGHAGVALRLQAQTFAALLDHHIEDTETLLSGVVATASLWDGNLDRLSDALRGLDIPPGDVVAISSAEGGVLLNTLRPQPSPAIKPVLSGYLLQQLQSHRAGVTNLYRGPQTGVFRIAIVRPMAQPPALADKSYSVVYSMQAARLVEELFTGVFPAGLAIEVSDRNGTVVAGSQRLANRIGQPVAPDILAETAKAESGLFRMPKRATEPGSVAFAHSRMTGFTVMVRASDASISPSVRAHVVQMLIATALFCLPGIVLILISTRRLSAGLGVLADIGSGNVSGLRPSAIREIDAAAATLVSAKSAEAAVRERLRLLNANLESRVEEAVAELELARERTVHARRLETLGTLASGVAHDFGNVLQVVDGCASLIVENSEESRAVERWAVMLEAEVKRGMAVVQRLMSYSRKEAIQAAEADVADLLDGVAEILRHTLPPRISVVVAVPPGLPAVWTDKAQLETVLMNLGTNARDAMPDGGTFTVSASLIQAANNETGYIRIDASDTGTGMPADVLARATEPFFTTKEVGKGTGLGLAMARDFAEKSGGRMSIASKPGQGTTVSLLLPVAQAAIPPVDDGASKIIAAAAVDEPVQLLLIDDSEDVRQVIARRLRKQGFAVQEVAEGELALARIAAGEKLDVVITDYQLAGIQGDDVISRLHGLRPGLPIILLTGDTTEAEIFLRDYEFRRSVRLMSKPASGVDLAETVHDLLHDHTVTHASPVNVAS